MCILYTHKPIESNKYILFHFEAGSSKILYINIDENEATERANNTETSFKITAAIYDFFKLPITIFTIE